MARPLVKFSPLRSTQPYWLGTKVVDPKITVPGGARINITGLPAQSDGRLYIPGGTALGRTIAERDAGTGYGLLADGDTDVVILLHDIWDAREEDYTDVLQPYAGNTLYRNFLPGWDSPSAIGITLTTAQKDLLQDGRYLCLKGIA